MDAKNWADPEDDLGLTRDDNPDIERDLTQIEDLTPKELDAKIQEAESTDSRSDNPQAGDFFVSNDGKMFLNGVEITDEQLAKENSYDEYANDPEHTLSEKLINQQKKVKKFPGYLHLKLYEIIGQLVELYSIDLTLHNLCSFHLK